MAFNEFFVTVFTEASLDHFVGSQVKKLESLYSKQLLEVLEAVEDPDYISKITSIGRIS